MKWTRRFAPKKVKQTTPSITNEPDWSNTLQLCKSPGYIVVVIVVVAVVVGVVDDVDDVDVDVWVAQG